MQGNQFAMPYKMSMGAVPKEGPLIVPSFVDFTAQTTYILDLTYVQQKAYLSMVQTIYVDNSLSTVPLYIIVATSNQTFKVPANSQAYIPIGMTNKLAVTLNSASGLVIPVFLLNVAMNPFVWSTNNPPSTNTSGALIVSDPVLEAGVVSGYYQSEQFEEASGGALMPQVAGTKMVTGTLSGTTANTIFTGSPGFQLTGLQVFLTPNSVLGTAGLITVTAAESTVGNIAQGSVFVPTTAVTGLTAAPAFLNFNSKYTSKASASNLTLTASAEPTTGSIYYNAFYALVPFVGG
jgi:hypothetical protein